jgi:steroid delta-isomerase-like uncharacterized protein
VFSLFSANGELDLPRLSATTAFASGGITMNSAHQTSGTVRLINHRVRRRRLLGGLLGGGLTTVLAARGWAARAQESTPGASEFPAILQEWAAAWSEHDDGSRLAAIYTADATHEEVPSGTIFSGPEAIAGYAASHFAAFPDVALELSSAFVAGDWAAAEWVYAGTYTGSLPGLPAGTGQPFSVRGTVVVELEGDKIRRSASYFDFYSLLVQLGVLPAPDAPATPAP